MELDNKNTILLIAKTSCHVDEEYEKFQHVMELFTI